MLNDTPAQKIDLLFDVKGVCVCYPRVKCRIVTEFKMLNPPPPQLYIQYLIMDFLTTYCRIKIILTIPP